MIEKEDQKKTLFKISLNFFNNSKSELILLMFTLSIYILFHYPLNTLLTKLLIDPFFKYVYAEKWYNDVIFYFLILLLIFRVYKYWKKQYYLNTLYSGLFAVTIIYIINRILKTWNFHSTWFIKEIYYSDIIVILSLLTLILIFKTHFFKYSLKRGPKGEELGFITDKPITEDKEDKLQYSNYAQAIALKILKTDAQKSFAIGINGKWGTGKTSFFNLIREKMKKEDPEIILIDFSPWNTESYKSIMIDFFETFEEKLSNYNSSISNQISKYSEKLLVLNEIESTKPFYNFLSSFFGKKKTLMELKKALEENIENLNKKIIVFIDDLDRLDNSEINEVLKLIRNTADFKNTFFIVAYDRNYVINSLTTLNSYNKEGFLEKIFQLEINLPYYEKEELCKKLCQNLIQFFPDREELIHRNILNDSNLIEQNLSSMRDVILLSNSIILNYENLKGNVDFKNLLYLEIIRIKYPSVYELLKTKNDEYLVLEKHEKSFYNLSLDENYPKLFSVLKSKNNRFNENLFGNIEGLIRELFNTQKTNFLSLRNVSKYENYFSYRLLEKTLDENEIREIFQKDIETIKRQLTIWINKGYEFDLIKRFSMVTSYRDIENYQNNLRLIFYLANQKSNRSKNIIGFDSNVIHNRFGYFKSFKKYDYDLDQHKKFLIDLLLISEPPFVFESNLIYDFNTRNFNSTQYLFPIEKEKLLDVAEFYITKYIEKFPKIDENLTSLLQSNISSQRPHPNVRSYFSDRIVQKVTNYLNSQILDDLILFLISKNEYNSYSIHPQIYDLFTSNDELKKYISERKDVNDSKLYGEFLKFVNKLERGNSPIEFEFEKINI
jgi:hypothetical protein